MLHLVLALALTAADAPQPPEKPPAQAATPPGAPPPPAPPQPAAPAKPRPHRSVTALRKACYGGKRKELMSGVRKQFENQAEDAMLRHETDIAIHWFRRAIAGGSERPGTLRRLGIALMSTGRPEDADAGNACADLLDRLWPPTPAPRR